MNIIASIFTTLIVTYSFGIGKYEIVDATKIDGNRVRVFNFDEFYIKILPGAVLFCFYYFQFVINWMEFCSSYAYCIWFFSRNKMTLTLDQERCLRDSLCEHLGSIALWTFYKIFFLVPKSIFKRIFNSLKEPEKAKNFVKIVEILCFPCLCTYNKCLRFLSEDFTVQLVLWSNSLHKSCRLAYYIMEYRNSDRGQGFFDLVQFNFTIIRYAISLSGSCFVYFYIRFIPKTPSQYDTSDVIYPLIPAIYTFVVSLYVTKTYSSSYLIVLKTTVQCYFLDEEMYVGDQRFADYVTVPFMEWWKPPKYGDEETTEAEVVIVRAGEEMMDQDMEISVPSEEEEYGKLTPVETEESDDQDKFYEKKPEYREDDGDFLLPEFIDQGQDEVKNETIQN